MKHLAVVGRHIPHRVYPDVAVRKAKSRVPVAGHGHIAERELPPVAAGLGGFKAAVWIDEERVLR